jgi:hypothetical protein
MLHGVIGIPHAWAWERVKPGDVEVELFMPQ